jgi:hypothetical protein
MLRFLYPRAEMEMVNASGALRVTIEHKYPKVLFLVHAASITAAIFWGWDSQGWDLPRASAMGAALLVLNIIGIAYYMTGSEVVEFNDRQIVRSRTNLGWQRTSEFELEKCSRLKWLEYFGKPGFFRCQYGWRTFSFGKYLSQKQADRLLAALERSLPTVANHLLRGASLRGAAIRS